MKILFNYIGADVWCDIPLLLLLLGAVFTDLRSRKVYNWMTFPAILYGLIYHSVHAFPYGAMKSLMGVFIVFIVLVGPFALYWIRAGDVKLLMAVGAITGPFFTVVVMLLSAIAGGVLALLYMIARRKFFKKIWFLITSFVFGNLFKSRAIDVDKGDLFPYTPAILLGAVAAYIEINYGPFIFMLR